MDRIRILLVDDERIVRQGLRMRLSLEADMSIVGEAGNGTDAIAELQSLQPDVVIVDYSMPGIDGLQTVREARAAGFSCSFVMFSGHHNEAIASLAIEAGAAAYVRKHEADTVLLSAIRQAAAFRPGGEHPS